MIILFQILTFFLWPSHKSGLNLEQSQCQQSNPIDCSLLVYDFDRNDAESGTMAFFPLMISTTTIRDLTHNVSQNQHFQDYDAIQNLCELMVNSTRGPPVTIWTNSNRLEAPNRGAPDIGSGKGYGASDTPVRIEGPWTVNDMKQGLLGKSPRGIGKPDLHHGGQMPGAAKHEISPKPHRSNKALHPNKSNQGVTPPMRASDRELHWWYRAREQGADSVLPDWIYDNY